MNGKHCLDTNIIIALFAGNENILTKLAQVEQVLLLRKINILAWWKILKSLIGKMNQRPYSGSFNIIIDKFLSP